MIVFPCAKINLGLNVVERREDGYHNIETVFYAIPLCDALEVKHMHDDFPAAQPCLLKVSGNVVDCNEDDNLVTRAYRALAVRYKLPRVYANLHKRIPFGAGLGGGSSDAAFMIRLLDERFRLNVGNAEMERIAATIGADCPFFITAETAFAQGIGDVLSPVDMSEGALAGYHIVLVKPEVSVSTKEAYGAIVPQRPAKSCRDIVRQPICTWRDELVNDFEKPVFAAHPELAAIKQKLYDLGAVYAAMSGSGSALFGLFAAKPGFDPAEIFEGSFTWSAKL